MKKLILFILASLFIFSCNKTNDHNITLGVIAPLTGEGATYGNAMKKGLDLAIEMHNKNAEYPIKLIYKDTQLKPSKAISSFKQLVDINKVPLVFGAAGSSISLAVTPFANTSKVVLFSSISTADDLDKAGEYFFRNIPKNSKQAETIAKYLDENQNVKSVAVYFENNDYGINMNSKFKEFYGNKNINFSDSYESGQRDFKQKLLEIKQVRPDAIFIPGTYNEIALILRQIKELGIKSLIISGDGAYSQVLLNNAGKAAEGLMVTLMSISDTLNSRYKNFQKEYFKKYNEATPNIYSIFSFDAANIVLSIIDNANKNKITGKYIKNQLKKITYSGVTGITKFNKVGGVDKLYNLYIVKNKKFVLYKKK